MKIITWNTGAQVNCCFWNLQVNRPLTHSKFMFWIKEYKYKKSVLFHSVFQSESIVRSNNIEFSTKFKPATIICLIEIIISSQTKASFGNREGDEDESVIKPDYFRPSYINISSQRLIYYLPIAVTTENEGRCSTIFLLILPNICIFPINSNSPIITRGCISHKTNIFILIHKFQP